MDRGIAVTAPQPLTEADALTHEVARAIEEIRIDADRIRQGIRAWDLPSTTTTRRRRS